MPTDNFHSDPLTSDLRLTRIHPSVPLANLLANDWGTHLNDDSQPTWSRTSQHKSRRKVFLTTGISGQPPTTLAQKKNTMKKNDKSIPRVTLWRHVLELFPTPLDHSPKYFIVSWRGEHQAGLNSAIWGTSLNLLI